MLGINFLISILYQAVSFCNTHKSCNKTLTLSLNLILKAISKHKFVTRNKIAFQYQEAPMEF